MDHLGERAGRDSRELEDARRFDGVHRRFGGWGVLDFYHQVDESFWQIRVCSVFVKGAEAFGEKSVVLLRVVVPVFSRGHLPRAFI